MGRESNLFRGRIFFSDINPKVIVAPPSIFREAARGPDQEGLIHEQCACREQSKVARAIYGMGGYRKVFELIAAEGSCFEDLGGGVTRNPLWGPT